MRFKFRILCLGFTILVLLLFTQDSFAKSKKHPVSGKPKIVRKIHPTKLYDHDMHTVNFFTPNNIPCESCHTRGEEYVWKTMNHDGCHNCHRWIKWESVEYASKDCSRCHEKWTVTPPNHRANWLNVHKTMVKADTKFCKNCHNDRFCERCHKQRNDIILNKHKRNYKYYHSIDARSNPKKCDRCHQVAFCTKCHASRRLR